MKKTDLKKLGMPKKMIVDKLITSFKRAVGIFGDETESASSSQIFIETPDVFVTYEELQRMNAQLLRMEQLKAEAIRFVNDQRRCF
ncbi:MAG: hypothetical protein ACLFU9_01825 [Candidatus Bathyarchaeia archaeon]